MFRLVSPIQSKVMDSMSWVILELPSTKTKAEFKILVQHQIMEGRSKKCHELNQLEVTIGIAYSINGDGLTVLGDPRITEWINSLR